jgi:hypothetical protein
MTQSAPEQSKPRRPHAGRMMQDLRYGPTVSQVLDLLAGHGRMTWRKRT